MEKGIIALAEWIIPGLILLVLVVALCRRLPVYELFIAGAQDGFEIAIKTIPYLVAMLVAVSIFRASGALDLLVKLLSPVLSPLGIPPEVLPHALLRPLSGSAALGVATDIIRTHGPDSMLGRLVSTMQGSSDTTFYVLSLYFGSVGIKKYRYAPITGLIADITTFLASVFFVRLIFG
ncbi:nucleoside recognition domain protein [Ammonifex degensii KC4]|uniref:Nucleoside recognition domain protein n=1 Tax=Ammonifex degensii (strain DSM 10501 / KC4) TaxID=429009 RepID=C9R7X2_AMMDK|nr:spore maturation protein [Ammonifex degensii]ACX52401.1 nucleoside recognition domain protein [Ammonifex degensii KC4]